MVSDEEVGGGSLSETSTQLVPRGEKSKMRKQREREVERWEQRPGGDDWRRRSWGEYYGCPRQQ